MKWTLLAPLVFGIVTAVVSLAAAENIRTRIAKAYGLDGWSEVEEIRYTFNVKSGQRETRRSWIWRPAERRVTFHDVTAGSEPVTYSLDDLDESPSDELKQIDHRFINDQYWLLFALHLEWDTDAAVEVKPDMPLVIGEGTATMVTVQYPDSGGYTPGDAYDIYVGAGDRIVQWAYRRGGSEEPTLTTTWENQRRLGPLLVPTEFRTRDGRLRVWFSDLSLELTGSDTVPHPK